MIRKIILKHATPTRIYLYGSRATGDSGETSDIDIAHNELSCLF
ncbi:MAG: nucleotidyltransferase domain-containing protein [Candidatus Kuenenia sp.]|nr:nucleotidyltransferase domain-containing protein [Candidatus Kuenenia hertensis]